MCFAMVEAKRSLTAPWRRRRARPTGVGRCMRLGQAMELSGREIHKGRGHGEEQSSVRVMCRLSSWGPELRFSKVRWHLCLGLTCWSESVSRWLTAAWMAAT